jgi:hypothetical protein
LLVRSRSRPLPAAFRDKAMFSRLRAAWLRAAKPRVAGGGGGGRTTLGGYSITRTSTAQSRPWSAKAPASLRLR